MPITGIPVHAFPECEEIWSQLDSSIRRLTLDVAAKVWTARESELADLLAPESIAILETSGVLVHRDGAWEFAVPPMLYFAQAINAIEEKDLVSLPADELPRVLAEMFRVAKKQSFDLVKEYRILASFILAQLVNRYDRLEVIEATALTQIPQFDFWQIYESICDALPILELSTEGFAHTLKSLTSREEGKAAPGKLYSAAVYLGRFHPVVAFDLVDRLAVAKDWTSTAFLERLLTGIADFSLEQLELVANRSMLWLDADEERLCQAAIYCCQNLILAGQLEPDWLLSRTSSLVSRPSDTVRYALAVAVTVLGVNLEESTEQCLEVLTELQATDSRDHVIDGIAGALPFHRTEQALSFAVSCLPLLVDVPLENKGTIGRICDALYPLAHYDSESVWGFLESWILAHEQPQESIVSHDMFLSAVQALKQSDLVGSQRALTRWFSSKDLRLVEQARLLIRELGIHDFASAEISEMSSGRVRYVTEKLLAGLPDPMQLLWLLYSIIRSTSRLEELESYFASVLRYLAWSYPGTARQFLDAVANDEDRSLATDLLRNASEYLEGYRAQLQDLFVPELVPSKRRVEKYHKFEAKKMQSIQEARQDDGPFMLHKLVPRIMIGRGSRTFHMDVFHQDPRQLRTFSEPEDFGHFSTSVELPKGEVLDPEGEAWSRFRRLTYTLGDFEVDE